MSFNTKGRSGKDLDQAKERNFIGYGIHLAAISGFEIKKATTGSEQVLLHLETPAVKSEDFVPADDAQWGGKVGKAAFGSYLANEQQQEEFMDKIALLADRLGVKDQVDAISEESLEAYMAKVVELVKGKMGYWKLCGREYEKDDGKVGVVNEVARYSFFKAPDQVEKVEQDGEGNITKVVVKDRKTMGNHMGFDKSNQYDYKALETSDEEPDEVVTNQGGGALWQ